MKRTLALILAVVLVLALASCAAPAAQQTEKPAEATTAQTTETPAAASDDGKITIFFTNAILTAPYCFASP